MLPCLRSLLKPFGDADMAIDVVEFDSNWEKLSGAQFTMQHSFFNPHDFAVTPNNYLFFQVTLDHRLQLPPSQCKVSSCLHDVLVLIWTNLIAPQAVFAYTRRHPMLVRRRILFCSCA